MVAQAISLTQFKWKDQAQAAGIEIQIDAELARVPMIPGNEADLRQALTNLIFNAVDALPKGGAITLRTRAEGGQVAVEVSDTGTGMTRQVRERCLEPFFTTKGEHGTGLGLGMVYGIVQRHEGEIEIDSEPGRGTTIRLRLPIGDEMAALDGASSSAGAATRALRILIAEDEPSLRRLLVEYLDLDGHTVESAANGQEAAEKFHAGSFDLVVTDRAMPRMSGDQLAVSIKRQAPGTPIIMLTGFGEMMTAADERPAGVDLVISKPITLGRLREALTQVVG